MSTRNIVKNIRSAAVIEGKPKLPTSGQLSEGEIAVNYAKGYETLSFKNNSNEIVSLSVKTVDDVTVNGNSVVSNKTANITMKGSTTPVADTYSTTAFPSPFESKAEHINASDKVDAALKKVETNISKLASDVITNGNTNSDAISKLANSAGTIDGSNNITYVKATNAHYITNATSVHDATVKLDSNVYFIENNVHTLGDAVGTLTSDVTTINSSVNTIGNEVITIKGDVNALKGDVKSLNGRVNTIESNVTSIGGKVTSLDTFTSDLQDQINSLRGIIMEFVDLDLPSGTLWAKCNIGATSESDYGDYFMWGSTTPNTADECTWANAPFNNGSSEFNETYFNPMKNTVCPNDILAKGYDVAYKTTNGAARMPTKAEIQELSDYTTNEWVTKYNGTRVNGRKFTSKTDPSKYIFIPAAGSCYNGSVGNVGGNGYVWSSSLGASYPSNAWYLDFSSGYCYMSNDYRCNGWSVRAVRNLPL